jgi:hypothetical protein
MRGGRRGLSPLRGSLPDAQPVHFRLPSLVLLRRAKSLPCLPQKCRNSHRNERQPVRIYGSRVKSLTRASSHFRRWLNHVAADS